MENKEKLVEEMVLDMFDYSRTLVNIETATEDSNFINRYKEALRGYATFLVNRNYRKLQEDEIVVIKDEYRYIKDMADRHNPFWFCAFGGCEGACKECKDTCEMSIFVKERKETAENLIRKIIKIGNKEKLGYLKLYVEDIEQLREEYGLGIKENENGSQNNL